MTLTMEAAGEPGGAVSALSSMATRALLRELARAYQADRGAAVEVESVGGVDAARRIEAGEVFDVVILARDAIDRLVARGHLAAGSRKDLARSGVALAVKAGAGRPPIGDEEAVKRAVLAARAVGTSTGPSGIALGELFSRWGIADALRGRIVTPPPGVPVAALIARGDVDLGFQQLAELQGVAGVDVLGPLPADIDIVTVFSGAVGARARRPAAARAWLDFVGSPGALDAKRRHGMESA